MAALLRRAAENLRGQICERRQRPAHRPALPPYRLRLSWLLHDDPVPAALGVVPPFLLRDLLNNVLSRGPALDTAPAGDLLVAGMVAIPIITRRIGVAQTWQSNLVGQQVMHDLRTAVYRHLQRLSLAFFTRTRTGEVQSRIANDIGGVQTVVTTTATSVVLERDHRHRPRRWR